MTLPEAVVSFALIAGLLTIIPGMDTALILRGTLARSRVYGISTAAGIQAGTLIWGAGAAMGAATLLAASQTAYRILTVVGAAYMIWLGVSMLWASRHRTKEPGHEQATLPTSDHRGRGFLMGLITNLSNPKVGVFYVAMIPQFVPAGVSPLWMGLLLATVHCALGSAWSGCLILGAGRVKQWIRGSALLVWVDRLTGGVLVLFGAKLAMHARA